MGKVKLIPALTGENAGDMASWYDLCGADELYYEAEGGEAVRTVKEIYRRADTPLIAAAPVRRFEDIKKLIYAGAKRVAADFSDADPAPLKEAVGRFGSDRVYWQLQAGELEETLHKAQKMQEDAGIGGILLKADLKDLGQARTADYLSVTLDIPVLVHAVSCDYQDIADAVRMTMASGIILHADKELDIMDLKQDLRQQRIDVCTFESRIPFEEFQTNSDGMVPCIAQDYRTGEVLMLAYMTKESYEKTIQTGKMTYYSRSRKELWTKGETSGHLQYVKSLTIDCDKDTILARVAQVGAACHTGNRTCFFTPLAQKEYNAHNPLEVFEQVYETIMDRKKNPKEGSYTNYLFDQGIDKILKKCGEEATEIVIAAKNPDSDELKYEICDYLYHMMVLMAERDVSWKEITDELAERH